MARRNRSTDSSTNSTPDEVQEDTVSTATEEVTEASPEAVEATVQATEEEVAETPSEKPAKEVDLTVFNEAVTSAVENRDGATGEVAPVFIEPVQKAYRDLDGLKAKNKAKAAINEEMKKAMNALDIATARAYLALTDALASTTSSGPKADRVPADPTEAFVQRVTGLRLALQLASDAVPEGVTDGWQDKARALFDESLPAAQSYAAWVGNTAEDKGDEPEASGVVKAAVKLSQGKAARVGKSGGGGGSTFTGERRDIAKHIQQVFADKAPGEFLTVAEIKNARSDEYGDNPPSAGAISIRLFPKAGGKCTVEGITPETNDKGKKGAVKSA